MIPSMAALNECVERGVDLLLVHEPTFYAFPFNEVKENRAVCLAMRGYNSSKITILPL